jgi:hypothetical protein
MKTTSQRKCKICGKPLDDGEDIVAVLSGSYDSDCDNLEDLYGTITFHPQCYRGVAGDDYYPGDRGDSNSSL